MFDSITGRLSGVIKTLRGQARLTEANVQDALREVRMALLEADVALPVVKDFIAQVRTRALGQEVVGSLTPGQALVGVVYDELTTLMGAANVPLELAVTPPAVVLMAGLQGSGKTTTSGKLARVLREESRKKVLVVSCDVYRPAAIEQLKTVAAQVGVDFFPSQPDQKPVDIARAAQEHARTHYHDVLIVDTAGRLAIDQAMMEEIQALHAALKPAETLFVVDAMQGQDAVNVAKAFNEALPLTGVILTKLDGDSRGGASCRCGMSPASRSSTSASARSSPISSRSIPSAWLRRILGMGDVLSLVEEARRTVDMEQAEKLAKKVKSGKGFDLEDFKMQMMQMNKMGGLNALMDKLPAQLSQMAQGAQVDEKVVGRTIGIINSMTPAERAKPELIKASRKRRIASGAGVPVQEVNRLLNQFEQMQKMMKMMSKGGMQKMMRGLRGMLPGMR
jgi:signal recognition particle subunit SRP54